MGDYHFNDDEVEFNKMMNTNDPLGQLSNLTIAKCVRHQHKQPRCLILVENEIFSFSCSDDLFFFSVRKFFESDTKNRYSLY